MDASFEGAEPHVTLRPSVPWVEDRGWLNLIGNWHYFAQPPGDNASWVKAIGPSSAGRAEVWLEGLTPNAMYVVAIDVGSGSWSGGGGPAFKIGASDAVGSLVSAQLPEQVLLVLITPTKDMSLVVVEPHALDIWIFNSAEVYRLKT